MRNDLPTGTVAFLFTDVEGSTRLLHELGAKSYAEALAGHRRVVREACATEGGVEVDTQGDAFFFAFPTAPGALGAARVFTEALASGPIQVRVGIHTGTPLVTTEGYVGHDVHRAARIAAAGHGGQVLVSSYDSMQGPLTADLAPEETTGRYLALNGFSWQLGFIVGPAVGAVILAAEPHALWIVAAAACCVGALGALALERFLPEAVRRTPSALPPATERLRPRRAVTSSR